MSEKPKEIVQSFYHEFEAGNIEASLALLAENVEWVNPLPEEIPFSGSYKGVAGVVAYLQLLADTLDMGPMKLHRVVAEDDVVMVTGHESSKVKASGLSYSMDWVHEFTVENGKIIAVREYNDTAEMLKAF
ncbi:hypothetical protein R50073_15810 [Maricurvus nonylphenolicus]|uniref:nuclear transport factor 2 family protein n=1 Tax=Maricurvus nonylphenolicus TaxID=1008307 RepID=UPI0036F43989